MSTNENDEILSNRTSEGRWHVEFPFEWDADDLVSRRQLLRWSVWASGALFASTGLLAALSFTRERRRGSLAAIVKAADVPVGEAHYFSYPVMLTAVGILAASGTRAWASGASKHLSPAAGS